MHPRWVWESALVTSYGVISFVERSVLTANTFNREPVSIGEEPMNSHEATCAGLAALQATVGGSPRDLPSTCHGDTSVAALTLVIVAQVIDIVILGAVDLACDC